MIFNLSFEMCVLFYEYLEGDEASDRKDVKIPVSNKLNLPSNPIASAFTEGF